MVEEIANSIQLEAGGLPPSYALITDTFGPGYRARALGIFNLGPSIGAAVGIAFGASIAAAFDWRDAFIAVEIVGIITAIALKFLIRDPERGSTDLHRDETATQPAGFIDTVRAFFGNPLLLRASLGSGATQFVTYGLGNFAVLFLMREKGMTLEQVAVWYALVVGFGMGSGMLASGSLLDRFTRKTRTAFALAPAISLGLALPFYVGFVWAPTWELALLLLMPVMFLNYFYLSASVALVQGELNPNKRVLAGHSSSW